MKKPRKNCAGCHGKGFLFLKNGPFVLGKFSPGLKICYCVESDDLFAEELKIRIIWIRKRESVRKSTYRHYLKNKRGVFHKLYI